MTRTPIILIVACLLAAFDSAHGAADARATAAAPPAAAAAHGAEMPFVADAGCPSGQCPIVLPPSAAVPSGNPRGLPGANVPATGVSSATLPAATQAAIVRVVNTRGRSRALGSGTLVDVADESGLVVTCAHLFRDGAGTVQVVFPNRQAHSAQLVRIDTAADLAALRISAPGVQPVRVAQQSPRQGDPLVSCGYGNDGRLWCNRGQALGYVSTAGSRGTETLELSGAARRGDSGGPVFNRDYELVAVLFGTNGRVVDGTCAGRVRRFLRGLSPRFGSDGGTSRAGQAPHVPHDDGIAAAPPTAPLVPVPPRTDPPRDPAPAENDRLARMERLIGRLNDAWGQLNTKVDRLGALVRGIRSARSGNPDDEADRPNSEEPSRLDPIVDCAQPWLSAKLTAALISIGVPGGIAGLAAGAVVYFVMRRGKRRLQSKLDRLRGGTDGVARNAAEPDAPTNRPVVRHRNQYVPYEVTELDQAWSSAHALVGEKYPGAVPYLKMAEGVKDQLLSGNSEPTITLGRIS